EIYDIFRKHEIESVAVGEVLEEEVFRVKHQGTVWADIPTFSLEAPENLLPSQEAAYFADFQDMGRQTIEVDDYAATLKALLQQPTIADKNWVYEQFDSESRGNTLKSPGNGTAVVQIEGKDKAIAISTDCNSRYIYLDPETGGKIAVAEAIRNIVAAGATPIGITDGLNYGNPTNPDVFWQMEKSIDGISEACRAFDVPVFSGNVSMYNQSHGNATNQEVFWQMEKSIDGISEACRGCDVDVISLNVSMYNQLVGRASYLAPIIGMVGLFEDLRRSLPVVLQAAGDVVYVVGKPD